MDNGIKNFLEDSLSRLLEVCPEAAKQQEPTGQEFGCACFDELEPVKVEAKRIVTMYTVRLEGVPEYSRIMAPNFIAKR